MKYGVKVGLYAPEAYWRLTSEAKSKIVNGCGARNQKFDLVPDSILGLDISEACNIHDYMYYAADATDAAKMEADRVFRNNLNRLVNATSTGLLKIIRRFFVKRYYDAVVMFGSEAFWADKNPDGTMREIEV